MPDVAETTMWLKVAVQNVFFSRAPFWLGLTHVNSVIWTRGLFLVDRNHGATPAGSLGMKTRLLSTTTTALVSLPFCRIYERASFLSRACRCPDRQFLLVRVRYIRTTHEAAAGPCFLSSHLQRPSFAEITSTGVARTAMSHERQSLIDKDAQSEAIPRGKLHTVCATTMVCLHGRKHPGQLPGRPSGIHPAVFRRLSPIAVPRPTFRKTPWPRSGVHSEPDLMPLRRMSISRPMVSPFYHM